MRTILAGALALLAVQPAQAWNDEGHMLMAAAAYDQLTSATKTRVATLLQLNRYPTNGHDDAAADDRAKAAFMLAATAPDAIKRDPQHYVDDGEDPGTVAGAAANSGFDDRTMHKYWHYIDLPISGDGTKVIQPPKVNAQERISRFRKTLASNATDALKAYDLVWLLHLVGDIHQPLHDATRFTRDARQSDHGGNGVKLANTTAKNLHAFWDNVLGDSESVSAIMIAARALPKPDAALAARQDAATWAREGLALAKSAVYAPPVGPGLGPYALDDHYKAVARQVAEQRVALAAARLARLLNSELK